jgi:hypothetical protein
LIRNSKLWTSNCSEPSSCRKSKRSPFYFDGSVACTRASLAWKTHFLYGIQFS